MKLVKNLGTLRYRTSLNSTVLLIKNTACIREDTQVWNVEIPV